ncbi:hypothetical protein Emag_006795 [Eimeria magna]
MSPKALHLLVAVTAACASTAVGEREAPTVPVIQPLPPLPALPPVDLSHEGVDALLSEMRSALTSPAAKEVNQPLASLLTRLSELLRSVEGRALPPKAEKEATKLTESLRSVFAQQSILRQKLSALQLVASDRLQPDVEGIRTAAGKLLDQYAELQTLGEETLAALRELLQAIFPILKQPEAVSSMYVHLLLLQQAQQQRPLRKKTGTETPQTFAQIAFYDVQQQQQQQQQQLQHPQQQ